VRQIQHGFKGRLSFGVQGQQQIPCAHRRQRDTRRFAGRGLARHQRVAGEALARSAAVGCTARRCRFTGGTDVAATRTIRTPDLPDAERIADGTQTTLMHATSTGRQRTGRKGEFSAASSFILARCGLRLEE
jgi:hypothetical protein